MTDPDQLCELLPSYLLNDLDAEVARRFERHLASCPLCLVRVEPTQELLRGLAAANANQPAPRRRRGALLLVGVAPGLLLGTVLGVALARAQTSKQAPSMVLPLRGQHLSGSLAVYRKAWGSAIMVTASGLPRHALVELTVTSTTGVTVESLWHGANLPQLTVVTPTPFAPSTIAATRLTLGPHHDTLWSWHRLGIAPSA
jgi:anti-sigma factor RsiW